MRRFVLPLLLLIASAAPASAKPDVWKPGKVLQRTSKMHGRAYSLFVPSKYSKKASWPLVISSHGRGGAGAGEMRPWQGLASSHGFIVACPDMVTATNHRQATSSLPPAEEDDQVLLSIVEEIREHFRVNPRAVMITGFSGGGNPSYHTGLRHPDVFTHICTRGGNFAPQQIPRDDEVLARGRKRLQIFIFYGEKDHPLIVGEGGAPGQARQAYDALQAAGYEKVTIEEVPSMKHESRPAKAAAWFAEYLEANKKRFREADKADALRSKAHAALAKERYADAVRTLLKCRALEEKVGLDALAAKELDALNERAMAQIEEAKKAHEAGDEKTAAKLLGDVVRFFRGLPAHDEAKRLKATW